MLSLQINVWLVRKILALAHVAPRNLAENGGSPLAPKWLVCARDKKKNHCEVNKANTFFLSFAF